jgi:hypothetical protein
MSKFWNTLKEVAKDGFKVADTVGDTVSPTWKAASALLDTPHGEEMKTDFVQNILAGEQTLLEKHSFDKLTPRQNEILDQIAVLATEFGIIEVQALSGQ